jgi:hypothetical protein
VNALAAASEPDSDGDGWTDSADNCVAVANPTRCDTNLDGFGNACNSDYNGDGIVGLVPDFMTFVANFALMMVPPASPDADSNCDGIIRLVPDFADFVAGFELGVSGPSGVFCAGGIPCP